MDSREINFSNRRLEQCHAGFATGGMTLVLKAYNPETAIQ
jgi:hypothetical protein